MKLQEYKTFEKRAPSLTIEKLREFAAEHKIDVGKATSIDETRQTILEAAHAKLSESDRAELAKERVQTMDNEQREREQAKSKAEPDDVTRTVRQINAAFCREVPQDLRNGGTVDKDHARFGGEYQVPNGTYRVTGSDYAFTFKGNRLAEVSKPSPDNKFGGDKVIDVPSEPAGPNG